ncbi:MAG TPA: carboxypeptidase-like regulatory domain-containing protein, partial [Terriglobia bacterium]|nr:carboxypeptidase-like regulatory domain-containing protein [Terriglobia bacterium]
MNADCRLRYFVTFVTTILLALSAPATAQVLKGSISGTVTDYIGAVVPSAAIKATNVDTGASVTATSDRAGMFRINLMPAGTYSVEVTSRGFRTLEIQDVPVIAGKDASLTNIHLTAGDSTPNTPLVESTQAQVSGAFSGRELGTFAGIQ